jgi:hypothetical protein
MTTNSSGELTGLSNTDTFLVKVVPSVVTLIDGSLGVAGNSKITDLTATTDYDVSVNGANEVVMTTNASGELTGLSNVKTYKVSAIV